jgi:hypothetical protein
LIEGGPSDLNDRILGAEYYDPIFLKKEATTTCLSTIRRKLR